MIPKSVLTLSKVIKNYEITASPHTAYRIIKGFFRARVLKKGTLRAIELYPTFACQLKCSMCSVEQYKKSSGQKKILNIDDYSKIAKTAGRLGATTIIVLGGEPTLYKDLRSLLAVFKKNHFFVHMVSNGVNLTREFLLDLKLSGLDSIFFSLESIEREVNDKIRGAGHFDNTLKNIELCKSIGLEVGLAPVFFPGQIERALAVVDFCHNSGIRASGGQISKIGKAVNLPSLSSEEVRRVKEAVDKYPNFVFDWSFSYFPGTACPAGREKLGITMNGDVIPCSYNPISFGNLFEEDLKEILDRMGRFSQFKKSYDGCLCSEDKCYIENYQSHIANEAEYPIMYYDHPNITKTKEPDMFNE
ncbi:radical SAM protein [Oligoflexia bacterium]|nr:radical SAM protein [Oligoflexia bacterium]